MGVREQQRSAACANQGEDQPRASRGDAAGLHSPLEPGKGDDQQNEGSVLQNLGDREALPEATWAERPVFRVRAEEQEDCQAEEGERPMAGPTGHAGSSQNREQPHAENEQAGPMVVVLRPSNVTRAVQIVGSPWNE